MRKQQKKTITTFFVLVLTYEKKRNLNIHKFYWFMV